MSELRDLYDKWVRMGSLSPLLDGLVAWTEAHDAAQPEPAQTYGDKRGTYAEQPAGPSDDWLAECAENWWVHQRGSTDTNRSWWALQYADRLIAAAREAEAVERALSDYSITTCGASFESTEDAIGQSLAALRDAEYDCVKLRADLAAAATREEEAVGALGQLRSLLAAAKAERLERERALPANAQAEKDLRKAEDILANVVDCIRGRITHRDPRDKREQLLWFASELKRAAEEIGGLLEERW